MNTYLGLALQYLKLNKKRSLITIFAVTIAVTVLYLILNIGWCKLLEVREELREEQNYEIVYLTETKEQIDAIASDELVKSALTGAYYDSDSGKTYENALYINTTSPYRMVSIQKKLDKKSGVASCLNVEMADTYLQAGDDTSVYILVIWVLLISFVFAILGVGVVRNSIQLSTLEQIKDYGNLRCIGASKQQLKRIIYMEGMILELTGNAIGLVTGFLLSLIVGHYMKMKVGFHIIPIVPILIAFLGDLYFAMNDNCKVVTKMTPVSAIRGEFRIRKEKIKLRKRNLFGMIFGVEGDYAYKNLLRNPGRFYKTIWGIGLGMAFFIGIMTMLEGFQKEKNLLMDLSNYYQFYIENIIDGSEDPEEVKAGLPSAESLERISNMDEITEAKRIYSANVIMKDWETHYSHLTDEYLTKTLSGEWFGKYYEKMKSEDSEEGEKYAAESVLSMIRCYGYDETDYKRCEKELIDGTLEVSENGIVLVKNGGLMPKELSDSLITKNIAVTYADYKVGDTIEILDTKRYSKLVQEALADAKKELSERKAEIERTAESKEDYSYTQKLEDANEEYFNKVMEIRAKYKKQLIKEGAYKTYTIEGIVKEDANRGADSETSMTIILPLENYYSLTGLDESCISGMKYHIAKASSKFCEKIIADEEIWNGMEDGGYCCSAYIDNMMLISSLEKIFKGILAGIVFALVMVTFNIINTTTSGIYLRKKEFAQLRVIGVSKKRLIKMVMLEGVIQSIAVNLIGIILGFGTCKLFFESIMKTMLDMEVQLPIASMILGMVLSTLVLCGSIYVSIRKLKMNMANDLATGGD